MTRRASLAAIPKGEIPIANAAEYDDRKNLFLMWAGAYGDNKVYVWADHFEDAFEEMVEFFDDQGACGIFTFIDDSDLRHAAEVELDIAWPGSFDDLDERDQERVREHVEVDLTTIGHTTLKCQEGKGMAYIPSWEWGGDEIDPKSADYKLVERACRPRVIPVTRETVWPAEEGLEPEVDNEEDGEVEIHVSDLDEDDGETFVDYAVKMIRDTLGHVEPDCGGKGCVPRWYTSSDDDINYRTGAHTRKSMHFDAKGGWSEEDRREIYADLKSRKLTH